MSLSKYSKRRGQFEALEAKQLFAADLVGGAAADLPDTPVVAGFDPGDLVAELSPGDLASVQMNPGDLVAEIDTKGFADLSVTDTTVGFSYAANLGGQEGESVSNSGNFARQKRANP